MTSSNQRGTSTPSTSPSRCLPVWWKRLSARPVARVRCSILSPAWLSGHPCCPGGFTRADGWSRWASEGEARRAALRAELSGRLDALVPVVLAEVLRRAHLTDLVLQYVDLDRVVSAVDLDAAAGHLDVAAVVKRVDVDQVADRVDLDAAARRLDIEAVLDRLDLTAVVLQRVDLGVLVQAVLDRIDLVALAAEVIEGVDLPEIIRESTGDHGVRHRPEGFRMQGIAADEAVGRAVDRLLLRRRDRSTDTPVPPS